MGSVVWSVLGLVMESVSWLVMGTVMWYWVYHVISVGSVIWSVMRSSSQSLPIITLIKVIKGSNCQKSLQILKCHHLPRAARAAKTQNCTASLKFQTWSHICRGWLCRDEQSRWTAFVTVHYHQRRLQRSSLDLLNSHHHLWLKENCDKKVSLSNVQLIQIKYQRTEPWSCTL